jgi:hypothetical protein
MGARIQRLITTTTVAHYSNASQLLLIMGSELVEESEMS